MRSVCIIRRQFGRVGSSVILTMALATALAGAEPAIAPVEASKQPSSDAANDAANDAAQLEFFEKKIRPVLTRECYQCHSTTAEKLQGGLYLDSREALLEGGDSGPAVVVGDPRKSLLVEALKHESFEMPPSKRLADEIVADFEQWIRTGLADPRERPADAVKQPRVLYSAADAKTHWAFQPISSPAPPAIDDHWIRTPIDAFILKRLQTAGLQPSPPADRRTLLRRAYYDLTGLPPSRAQVEAFEAASLDEETSPAVFARTVDALLDSPHYGEKWGRHWLDVARYADTNGQRPAPTTDPPFYPFAWVYRDYVIDAFNRDLPFDRFVVEQLAGDHVAADDDRRALAGLGLLRVGKSFGQNLDDRIDDRIDTVSKAFLGLTVACARCHDHKLDPIYQSDYYALHGVFSSSDDVDSLYRDTAGTPQHAEYLRQRDELIAEIEGECLENLNRFMHGLSSQAAEYLLGAEKFRDGRLSETAPSLASREVGLQPIPYQAWLAALERWEKQDTPAYRPWFAFAALPEDEFAAKAPAILEQVIKRSLQGKPIPALVARNFEEQRPKSLAEVAQVYESIFLDVEREADGQYPMAALLCYLESSPSLFRKEYYSHSALPPSLPDAELEALRQVTLGFDGPYFMAPRELMQCGAADARKAMVRRKHEVFALERDHPGAPIRVMTMHDAAQPMDSPLYIRGERTSPGEIVPRRFLKRLSEEHAPPFSQGSGRLELARAIASADNPLTARVIVNRVWQWHFGAGLAATPSDFGLNGESPSHPELLEWLATWFIREGWSLKKLHRLIMNSSVYQQASRPRAAGLEADSENRLLWRMTPRRMTYEELRDTWLTAAGELERELGGRPEDPQSSRRRSVYLLIDRYDLPDALHTFDFANPEFSTARREATIVPQQALFTMNGPWLMERASKLAARSEVAAGPTSRRQITAIYEIVHQRRPDEQELTIAQRYLAGFPPDQAATALQRLAHAILQANEAVYVH